MSRFERWVYVVLAAVVLLWPGVRRQFLLQIRQITHTTDVRVSSWPRWEGYLTHYSEHPFPVPFKKIEQTAEKHGYWEALAEFRCAEGPAQYPTNDTALAIKSLDKALAANPHSKTAMARRFMLKMREVDFYRLEQRSLDEKRLGRLGPYPSEISKEVAQPLVDMAHAGQKLDPRNALYNYGLAYVYVGMHKDDEAIAAANRGWRKAEFDTYDKEASLNTRRLLLEAGVPGIEAGYYAQNPFHFLVLMRRLAQNLQAIALKAEESGDRDRGWELRLAAFRIGNRLIRSGQEYAVPLVGVAVQQIAVGGLPRTAQQAEQLKKTHNDQRLDDQITLTIIRDYVAKHKLGPDGNWVASQYKAGQEFRRLYHELSKDDLRLYYHFEWTDGHWYMGESLLVGLFAMLAIFGILSLPRGIRRAEAGRSAAILGIVGALLTGGGFLLAIHLALRTLITKPTPIAAGVTWGIIAILPVLIIVFGLARRSGLASIRTSARYALVTLAVLYVGLSAILAVERDAFERYALQNIEQGLNPKQVEILKKTEFRR